MRAATANNSVANGQTQAFYTHFTLIHTPHTPISTHTHTAECLSLWAVPKGEAVYEKPHIHTSFKPIPKVKPVVADVPLPKHLTPEFYLLGQYFNFKVCFNKKKKQTQPPTLTFTEIEKSRPYMWEKMSNYLSHTHWMCLWAPEHGEREGGKEWLKANKRKQKQLPTWGPPD